MSEDGLVPKVFSEPHPKFKTPWKSNMLFFVFTSLFAAFLPDSIRRRNDQHRHIVCIHSGVRWRMDTAPQAPSGSAARFHGSSAASGCDPGHLSCAGAMIFGLGWTNWLRLIVWLAIGLVFYFAYGKKHSKLQTEGP